MKIYSQSIRCIYLPIISFNISLAERIIINGINDRWERSKRARQLLANGQLLLVYMQMNDLLHYKRPFPFHYIWQMVWVYGPSFIGSSMFMASPFPLTRPGQFNSFLCNNYYYLWFYDLFRKSKRQHIAAGRLKCCIKMHTYIIFI